MAGQNLPEVYSDGAPPVDVAGMDYTTEAVRASLLKQFRELPGINEIGELLAFANFTSDQELQAVSVINWYVDEYCETEEQKKSIRSFLYSWICGTIGRYGRGRAEAVQVGTGLISEKIMSLVMGHGNKSRNHDGDRILRRSDFNNNGNQNHSNNQG